MPFDSSFKTYRHHNPLAIKLLAAIILCSSLITLVSTLAQLYSDYRYERNAIDDQIAQIESTTLPSLANSLWEISPRQIQLQLEGILQLPDVEYVTLETPFNERYTSGELPQASVIKKDYPLFHTSADSQFELGSLQLVISLDNIYSRLWDKAWFILLSQGVKTFVVSIFILSIFYHLVTQHLAALAVYARRLRLDKLDLPLVLRRRGKPADELNEVVLSMNTMRETMLADIAKRKAAEQALEDLNSDLEKRVEERTLALEKTNKELQQALEHIQHTQQQLVQSEKMAALGNLVAGVAHEISTPIGISFTAASLLEQQATQYEGELASLTLESSQMIRQNLERAAQLITAFKQVSVDQSSERRRPFYVTDYLEEIILSLKPMLRELHPIINIHCDKTLVIDSYPGCYYQIFNNLIINSLIHGFSQTQAPQIDIEFTINDNQMQIDYRDNGVGLDKTWREQVFNPFVTSKRNQGCSGLGMHITFNLVSQLLKGNISCLQSDDGAHFRIDAPIGLD